MLNTTSSNIGNPAIGVPASGLKRFLNYIIDIIDFGVILIIIFFALRLISPEAIHFVQYQQENNPLPTALVYLLAYALFMGLAEYFYKGRSIGKFITKTRVVNTNGSPNISLKTTLSRGFIRAIPFSFISAFGNPCCPWQDKWTNTMVVNDPKRNQ